MPFTPPTIVYRTAGVWGGGQGSDLTAPTIDENFFNLYSAIVALQDHVLSSDNAIDFFSVTGNQLFVHMMNHEVLGPYTLPTAEWNFRGQWQPDTTYAVMDVITINGAVYLVLFAHVSQSSFLAGANDGLGHQYYGLLLAQPTDELPDDGTSGQILKVIARGSPAGPPGTEWATPTRVLGIFIEGLPAADELVLQYVVPEVMTLPAGLVGSKAYAENLPTTLQVFSLYQNGSFLGTIDFSPSPAIDYSFTSSVLFNPGDVLTIQGPGHPDGHLSNISITLVANLP